VVHGHCHHRALVHMDADRQVLARLGVKYELLDSGCCGMAGAFGFERDHYPVSMAAGERVLLPAVRRASRDTLIVADGFSCREQIAQATDRRALHLAEVLQMAMRSGPSGPPGDLPERTEVVDYSGETLSALTIGLGALAIAVVIAAIRPLGGLKRAVQARALRTFPMRACDVSGLQRMPPGHGSPASA
jgi:hypothetical protein